MKSRHKVLSIEGDCKGNSEFGNAAMSSSERKGPPVKSIPEEQFPPVKDRDPSAPARLLFSSPKRFCRVFESSLPQENCSISNYRLSSAPAPILNSHFHRLYFLSMSFLAVFLRVYYFISCAPSNTYHLTPTLKKFLHNRRYHSDAIIKHNIFLHTCNFNFKFTFHLR